MEHLRIAGTHNGQPVYDDDYSIAWIGDARSDAWVTAGEEAGGGTIMSAAVVNDTATYSVPAQFKAFSLSDAKAKTALPPLLSFPYDKGADGGLSESHHGRDGALRRHRMLRRGPV